MSGSSAFGNCDLSLWIKLRSLKQQDIQRLYNLYLVSLWAPCQLNRACKTTDPAESKSSRSKFRSKAKRSFNMLNLLWPTCCKEIQNRSGEYSNYGKREQKWHESLENTEDTEDALLHCCATPCYSVHCISMCYVTMYQLHVVAMHQSSRLHSICNFQAEHLKCLAA